MLNTLLADAADAVAAAAAAPTCSTRATESATNAFSGSIYDKSCNSLNARQLL